MIIKSLPLLLVVAAAVGVIGLFGLSSPVVAQQPDITRALTDATGQTISQVAPGDELTVTISNLGLGATGGFGNVVETVPAGFTYVTGSAIPVDSPTQAAVGAPTVDGQDHDFYMVGVNAFRYKLTVGSDVAADRYHFSGIFKGFGGVQRNILGQDGITVTGSTTPPPASTPTVRRSLPVNSVTPDSTINVRIDNLGLGPTGGTATVNETLPSGFSYVSGSATVDDGASGAVVGAEVSGQSVKFTLVGVNSFTYQASIGSNVADGSHTFSGTLTSFSGVVTDIIGNQNVTVRAPEPMPVSRSFSPDGVDAGTEVTVTISNLDLGTTGGIATVNETLPAGFSYVSGSATVADGASGAAIGAEVSGQNVEFTLVGVDSFSYRVTFGSDVANGQHDFSGTVTSFSGDVTDIAGDSNLRVGPEPTPTPTATPEPTATPTPAPTPGPDDPTDATPTPRPTQVPAPTPTPVAIEIVDVTAVDGASTVQPDASATVSSADGMATLMLPKTSRARTYQVMVSSDASTCPGVNDLSGSRQAGANVSVYDAEGSMESGVMLIRRATVQMMLSSDTVDDLGGLPVVFQANALGAFSVHQSGVNDNWSMRGFSMGLTDDGGVTATVTSLSSLGCLALTVDEGILEQASFQVAGITPTPTPRPATPVPTATPEPTPTPEPVEEEPKVGDTTAPIGLLIVLALTGALMIYTGSRVVRSRRPTRL